MIRRIIGFLGVLLLVTTIIYMPEVKAAPTTIDAPQYFGVSPYLGESMVFTVSAPDDMREYIDNGTLPSYAKMQIDYKLDNNDWHYTSDWDTAGVSLKNTFSCTFTKDKTYISQDRTNISSLFPEDATILQPLKDRNWDWNYFKEHSLSFRARFVVSFDNGKTYTYSDWSNTYVLSDNVKSDPDKLMSNAPTLLTAVVEKNSGGMPFLSVTTGRLPGEVQYLNAMSADTVWTEIWMRKLGDTDFKKVNSVHFSNEVFSIGVADYFDKALASYDAESYEIKTRYSLDLRKYPQAGRSDMIYSPFSNIISHNMPAWSNASTWATEELQKADDSGLIPDILKGADLTKPVSREEFAELAVLLYEKTTGKVSIAITPNPFTDTSNSQILKAYNLGITNGTSATTFSPKELITREQCSAMLFRALKAIAPEDNYSIDGIKDFPDQKNISGWAVEAAKYMSNIGIIKGDAQGNFMPKATTNTQEAAGYGMATREQAILMSVRTFEIYK